MVEGEGVAKMKDQIHNHTDAPDFRGDADKHEMSLKAFSQKEEHQAVYSGNENKFALLFTWKEVKTWGREKLTH